MNKTPTQQALKALSFSNMFFFVSHKPYTILIKVLTGFSYNLIFTCVSYAFFILSLHIIDSIGLEETWKETNPGNSSRQTSDLTSPLDQFEVRNLLSLDAPVLDNLHISLTNIRLYLTISALVALVLNFLARRQKKAITKSWSICQQSLYATIHSIVINQLNPNKGQMHFPFIYALFIFILIWQIWYRTVLLPLRILSLHFLLVSPLY